jgi:NSS family neurotransmitter:Na+ symporter
MNRPASHTGEEERWGSQIGFVLAAIGSAAGLGNIWRFSYVAGENGGAAFLLIYLVCVLLLGIPLIVAELAVGRRAHSDAVAAFVASVHARRWGAVGAVGVLSACLVLSFYSVVAGWALMYFWGAVDGALWGLAGSEYGSFFAAEIAAGWWPAFWHLLMMLAAGIVVAGGVRQGIEAFNRVAMPALFGIVLVLAGFSLSLEGAQAGLAFLFAPDWAAFSRPGVYLAAMGQAFFSLSIGMAIFVTYGSYMAERQRIPVAAIWCALGDTLLAVIAGVAIFPAVFSFGLDPRQGPELAFVTLPALFSQMPLGHLIGTVFFGLLITAALTSMVSVLEVPVAYLRRVSGWNRRRVTWMTVLVIFVAGVPSALSFGTLGEVKLAGMGVLAVVDFAASNLLLPISALLVGLFVGWKWRPEQARASSDLADSPLGRIWLGLVRYVASPAILMILLRGLDIL